MAGLSNAASASACPAGSPEECFRRHSARVARWAGALCASRADALDVAQEVFLRLLRSAPAFASDAAARGWLRTTTCRLAIDSWRRTRTRKSAERDAPPPRAPEAPALTIDRDEFRARLRAALGALSDSQRQVVLAKLIDGLTFAEIAEELEIAASTAKTHFVRGLEHLRRQLGGSGYEDIA